VCGRKLEVQLPEWRTHRIEGCVPTGSVARTRRSDTGEMAEPEAIRLAQQGDAAAFERLYQLHSRRVYSLCLRMVGNTAEAEDLTQEAFLQLFRKIATFRGESAFSTWLHRLAVNVVLMKLRKKSGKETSLEQVTEGDEEAGTPRRDFGAIDIELTGSIDRVNLQRAVDQLPPGTNRFSFCTMSRDTSTTRLRRSWVVRSAIPSRSFTKHACAFATCCMRQSARRPARSAAPQGALPVARIEHEHDRM
jgi:RNA polymerase sigma factor (sigma-70 family)